MKQQKQEFSKEHTRSVSANDRHHGCHHSKTALAIMYCA